MSAHRFSRRDFARLSGTALASATFAPHLANAAAAMADTPNAQMQAVLDALAALHPLPIPSLTPDQARNDPSFQDALLAVVSKAGKPAVEPVAEIRHVLIPTTGGASIIARAYIPADAPKPAPVAVYFHGGGWVIANLDTYDASCRSLANGAGCIVVSAAYRQAPEHRFPAAAQDAFAAYRYARSSAATFGGDPARVALVGESAGGNLAMAASLQARDAGERLPSAQVLVYPITDDAFDTPSYQTYAMAKPLDTPTMKWFFAQYLRSPQDGRNPLVSVARANLRGLPPTTIINAEIDPLRDDGLKLHDRLRAAGVSSTRFVHRGVTHEFFGMGAVVDEARRAMGEATSALKTAFGRAG